MSSVMFKGDLVIRRGILDAMREYAAKHPDTNTFTGRRGGSKGWLHNRSFKYAVWHGGRAYPPKHILSKATGVPRGEFSGGSQTNEVFAQLGFQVIAKHVAKLKLWDQDPSAQSLCSV